MRWVIVLLVGLTGCPATPSDDDVPDAPLPTTTALHLGWRSNPETIPGQASGDVRIDHVTYYVANLRVVGDAGAIEPTNLETLEWGDGQGPGQLQFPDPSVGLYARVVFELAGPGGEEGAEIEGVADIEGSPEPFKIEIAPITISVDVAIELEPGSDVTQLITVDFSKVVNAVDYAALPVEDGTRVLEEDSPQTTEIRNKLEASFGDGGTSTPG